MFGLRAETRVVETASRAFVDAKSIKIIPSNIDT